MLTTSSLCVVQFIATFSSQYTLAQEQCFSRNPGKALVGGNFDQIIRTTEVECTMACQQATTHQCKAAVHYSQIGICLLYDFDETDRPELVIDSPPGDFTTILRLAPCHTTITTVQPIQSIPTPDCYSYRDVDPNCRRKAMEGQCKHPDPHMESNCRYTCCISLRDGYSKPGPIRIRTNSNSAWYKPGK